MSDPLHVTGMVLTAVPSGEYDRRIVLLTRERGKITAFARGARRTNSPLLAAANPFAFGTFTVYEGRNAYTLVRAEVSEYYTRENLDGSAVLNLLYATLRALTKKAPDNELIRCIFEMKAMVLNGEYPYDVVQNPSLSESARYALAFVLQAPLQKLYTFTLAPEVFSEFRGVQDRLNAMQIDRSFKSLKILRAMVDGIA